MAWPGAVAAIEPAPSWRPTKGWGLAYLKGLLALLLLTGLLFLVNIVVPLGRETLGRVPFTLALIALGWGLGMVVLLLVPVRPLRLLAGALGLTVPILVILGTLAIWEVGDGVVLLRVLGASGVLVVFALLATPSFYHALRRRWPAVTLSSLAFIGLGCLVLVLDILGAPVDPQATESGWRLAFGLAFASCLLLVPEWRRPAARWFAWAAFAQFALASGLDPWVDGGVSTRMNIASAILVLVLGLSALTLSFIPVRTEETSGA